MDPDITNGSKRQRHYDAMDLNRWSTAGVNGSAAIRKKFITAFICPSDLPYGDPSFGGINYVANAGSTVNIYRWRWWRVLMGCNP